MIHCYNGTLSSHGKEVRSHTGGMKEGQVVRVEWGVKGVRFFVGGVLRGKTIAWGVAAPAHVRAIACMWGVGSSATFDE